MRIVMISAEYPPMAGGVGDYTRRLNGMLTQHGHEVAVITGPQGQAYRDAARIYPVRIPVWNNSAIATIRQTIAALQPEIVHIQYQTGAYQMKVAINTLPRALKRERQRGLRVVTTAHDLLPPYLFPKAGPLRTWYTKRIIKDADGAVMTNAGDYRRVMDEPRGPWNPQTVFIPIGANVSPAPPDGYDRALWRSRFDLQSGDMLLAYFGLLTHTKGIETILDALAALPTTMRLVLIGGAGESVADQTYAHGIRQRIAEAGLQHRVIVTGHAEPNDVSAYLMAADAVLLPFSDGYSYRRGSLITALAHGTPVITTYAPADIVQDPLPELVDGKHALLIEPNNVTQLVDAVLRLQRDQELTYWMGRHAKVLTDVFSWERIVNQHLTFYETMR
ncbi:MAG: glycosyltransferase family 4 protein [Roseiflexaceae bacterium]|jgi:glycosyltransferase involved in cell wall biosynthesis